MSDRSVEPQAGVRASEANGREMRQGPRPASGLRILRTALWAMVGKRLSRPATKYREIHRAEPYLATGPHWESISPTVPARTSTERSHGRAWEGARCLVTGASSGLGRALAARLVRAGAQVVHIEMAPRHGRAASHLNRPIKPPGMPKTLGTRHPKR
jgi:hypothetical protein